MKNQQMPRYAHVIAESVERDRSLCSLRDHAPDIIYYLRFSEIEKDYEEKAAVIWQEIRNLYPVAHTEEYEVSWNEFDRTFLVILEIMAKEKAQGNIVIPHIFSGSHISAMAMHAASCLIGQSLEYFRAEKYFPIKSGVRPDTRVVLPPLPMVLPDHRSCVMLKFLLDYTKSHKDSPWQGRRADLAIDMRSQWTRYRNPSKLPKPDSFLTFTTNTLKYCVDKGYILREDIKAGRMKLTLTASGQLLAKAWEILSRYRLES